MKMKEAVKLISDRIIEVRDAGSTLLEPAKYGSITILIYNCMCHHIVMLSMFVVYLLNNNIDVLTTEDEEILNRFLSLDPISIPEEIKTPDGLITYVKSKIKIIDEYIKEVDKPIHEPTCISQ